MRIAPFAAWALLCVSCVQQDPQTRKEIADLQNEVAFLKARINTIQNQQYTIRAEHNAQNPASAFLTPQDEGYSVIKMDLGYLTVKVQDVKPYANGSKVVLKFGNTLNSGIDGLSTSLEWGSLDSIGLPNYSIEKKKDVTFTGLVPSGSWKNFEVALDGFEPSKLGYVMVKNVRHAGIRLSR